MNILVTGVAGFFGSNLTEYLLEKRHKVVGIDNFNSYYSPSIKEHNIKEFKDHKNFILYRKDILDLNAMEKIFKENDKFDAIIHLAAWAGVTYSIDKPALYVKNNIEGTVNIANFAIKNKVKNFIFASTSSVYGSNPTPFDEEMKIDTPKAPYPVTKRACELMLRTFSENHGLKVTVLRIFNPQGKRARPDLAIPKLIRSCEYKTEFPIYQDLEGTGRDYCYIGHMFEAIDHILKNPFKFEIFNLGNSTPVTLGQLIEIVEEVTGKKVNGKRMPDRQGEMQMTYANIDKAKEMLGYNPNTSIKECIKIFYKWYLKQDESYKKGEI